MALKTTRTFKVDDKAHAELFNNMVKVLVENDSELLDQFIEHGSCHSRIYR